MIPSFFSIFAVLQFYPTGFERFSVGAHLVRASGGKVSQSANGLCPRAAASVAQAEVVANTAELLHEDMEEGVNCSIPVLRLLT